MILSYPDIRTFIRQEFCEAIEEKFPSPSLIAGVATGGIPLGTLIAQELGVSPMSGRQTKVTVFKIRLKE